MKKKSTSQSVSLKLRVQNLRTRCPVLSRRRGTFGVRARPRAAFGRFTSVLTCDAVSKTAPASVPVSGRFGPVLCATEGPRSAHNRDCYY